MASKQVQFGRAQLGYKPGGRSLLRRCLRKRDLPRTGRWRRADQRTYRTAYANRDEAWGAHAREVRSVSVWRSFVNRHTRKYLQLHIVPLASVDDVPEALEAARNGSLRNFRARIEIVETLDVELPSGIVGATHVTGVEDRTKGLGDRTIRTLYFTVGRYLVAFVASGIDGVWTWESLVELAEKQAALLPAEQRAPNAPAS